MRQGLGNILKIKAQEGSPVKNLLKKYLVPAAGSMLLLASPAQAQYGDGGGAGAASSASTGKSGSSTFFSYVDVMYSYQQDETDDEFTLNEGGGLFGGGSSTEVDPIDAAQGINVLAGFRRQGWYGFEFGLGYAKDGDVEKLSAMFNTLIYPFDESEFYLKLATGATRYEEYPIQRGLDPIADGDDGFVTGNFGAGLGYVFPLELAEKPFGIRFEAVYMVGDRFLERESDFEEDIRAPGTLKEIQFNVGLRFPL